MARKISQLTSAVDITSDDLIQIVDVEDGVMAPSGTNKKTTAGLLANQLVPLISDGAIPGAKVSPNFGATQVVAYGSGGITTNTAIGLDSLISNTTGASNIAVGSQALRYNLSGGLNTAIGVRALRGNSVISENTGSNNTATGTDALRSNTTGASNTASGMNALYVNTTGYDNTSVGADAMYANTTGYQNTSIGRLSSYLNTTGTGNTAVGFEALKNNNGGGSNNTAIGADALSNTSGFSNTSGLGYGARVTASNQVQLGNSSTTTYAYGAVQNRSDIRDKADVQDTVLGLEFVTALRPVDFRWDMREDYSKDRLANVTHDGTRKRSRFHHGLIAQEVKALIAATGIDFGGYQDHSISGGDDVLSIGYEELIGPMIKAIQELNTKIIELQSK